MSRRGKKRRPSVSGGAGRGTVSPAATAQTAAATQSNLQPRATRTDPPPEARTIGPVPLRKDQQRALKAYEWVSAAKDVSGEYEIAVQSFAAALLRNGFAAAVSVLERNTERRGFQQLLCNLASWPLPGIDARCPKEWPAQVRGLPDITQYMQATRELILLLNWLRRACRASTLETPDA